MDHTPETPIYATEYTPETITNASSRLEQAIQASGSLEDYLLSMQVDHSRTPQDRAELLRLERVARVMTAPIDTRESPESMAFYNGGLLASALLKELNPEGALTGGSLAHEYLNHYLTKERLTRDLNIPMQNWNAVIQNLCRDLQHDTLTWRQEQYKATKHFNGAAAHLATLYTEDTDEYYHALAGFWTPVKHLYAPEMSRYTEGLIESTDRFFDDTSINAHASPSYTPSVDKLNEMTDNLEAGPRFIKMDSEKEALMEAFYALYDSSFATMTTTLQDTALKYGIYHYLENALNTYNAQHDFFEPEDLVHVEGTYYYTVKEGEDDPVIRKTHKGSVLMGLFDSLIIVETPGLQTGMRTAHSIETGIQPLNEIRQLPAPALLLRNVTLMTEDATEYLEDTTIAIPLCYKRAKISTVL